MSDISNSSLYIPAAKPIYERLYTTAETILRVVAGVGLVIHGAPKIVNPFGSVGMVENLGFYPGLFWSPLLAATEFFGGLLLIFGLLRPRVGAHLHHVASPPPLPGVMQTQRRTERPYVARRT